jgi:hypothetical protein
MPTAEELSRLLISPNETLAVEYKSWLLDDEDQLQRTRATLAKAAIALANHGGGVVVLGMREPGDGQGPLASQPRPAGLRRYRQDDINAWVNRFADPPLHCEVLFAVHPETDVEHAFVVVPGGSATPVMSTRDFAGVIRQRSCYVRKPGPISEEIFTAFEWRALLDRCVRAGHDNLLDAIRLIVQGRPETGLGEADELERFTAAARDRWVELIQGTPVGDPARMELGRYELAFEIRGTAPAPTLVELRRRLEVADQIHHTGWGAFVNLRREPFIPRPRGDLIEAWLGHPEERRITRTPAHCDFWQASRHGCLFLLRGFDEDGFGERIQPGAGFDFTVPIWRVGEALLHVARLAREFGDGASIACQCRYTGLAGRRLVAANPTRHLFGSYVCADDTATLETLATVDEILNNLPEIIHPMLVPLYERFSFFELRMDLVVGELEALRRGRF